MIFRQLFHAAFVVLLGFMVGCGNPRTSILGDEAFVPFPRNLTSTERRALRAEQLGTVSQALSRGESFYLAIRRSELERRFFLTAFARQYHPNGVGGLAAAQMGTRVVSFRIQNGKLFLFDVADNYRMSEAFDPELVLEAWPIVRGVREFEDDPHSRHYVLIDPAAGLNRFSLLSERLGSARFGIEISFLQAFRRLADGVTFEQLFTGEAAVPIHGVSGGEPNVLRASGTLGITLRNYSQGDGFLQTRPPSGAPTFYFLSEPRIVPNTGRTEQTPVKWNIHPGMDPIRWTISPNVIRLKSDPFYSRYDIAGAITRAVENWNSVFGYRVFEAQVGDSDATPADDVTNYIDVDVNPAVGFARANWRTNPNTGEVRGASVYFNTVFIVSAAMQFDSGAVGGPAAEALRAAATEPEWSLSWAGLREEKLCTMPASPMLGEDLIAARQAGLEGAAGSGPELVERVITEVMLHEIGHTLGLRHNFKGSLLPPSSSTMDYLLNRDAILRTNPGSWDVDAVQYLYGLSANLPPQPFCNDSGTEFDPDCTRYDSGSNPLSNYWIPIYNTAIERFLRGETQLVPSANTLNTLLAYVRAGSSSAIRREAFDAAFSPVTSLSPPGMGRLGARVDFWSGALQRRLFLDPPAARRSSRNAIVNDPQLALDPELGALVFAQQGGYLRNTNTVTSFFNRRTSVDVLKKIQLLPAYSELVQAREAIAETADPSDLETRDLLSRIDAAINPYFR
jgi:hypothetical protein